MAFESAITIAAGGKVASPQPARSRAVDALLPRLFTLIVLMLFILSGSVLWTLGINYEGITGSAATKIHPATYLAGLTILFLLAAARDRTALIASFITRSWGTFALLLATLFMGFYIVLGKRSGIAAVFDTFLLTVAVSVMIAALSDRAVYRTEKLLHLLLAANAVIGIVEQLINYRFFPYRFDGEPLIDSRSTALLGHPLVDAALTGVYVLILLGGGGRSLPRALRPMVIGLQLVAMAAFGGRTAMAVVVLTLVLWSIPRILAFFGGRRVGLPVLAAAAFILPALVAGIAMLAWAGYFDVFLERIANDGGSAHARLAMLDLFDRFSWRDILLGPPTDLVNSLRSSDGLALGVENPIIRMVLYQGAAVTLFMTAGVTLFLVEMRRRLSAGTAMVFFFFVIVMNSFESIANKTTMLAQFAVLMLVMFHRYGDRPSAATMAGSKRRD